MSRPELRTGRHLLPGLAAVALFVVFAAVFLTASFPEPAGFGEDAAIMKSLGAALIGIEASAIVSDGTAVPSEGFLVPFIVIAVALDAALDGSLMLARREEPGENVTVGTEAPGSAESPAAATDGGVQGGDDA
jgi:NADH-quinone oxidoreductase subunit J